MLISMDTAWLQMSAALLMVVASLLLNTCLNQLAAKLCQGLYKLLVASDPRLSTMIEVLNRFGSME